jgi:diguanylate cyclase (GGDEF)-like protein/PAS domain S-box-containing protein
MHPPDDPSRDHPEPGPDLRRRAEVQLESLDRAREGPLAPAASERLLHELRVHQIELELQNEELRQTQQTLALSQARYFDLFDLAPVGYLTLSEAGLIQEANLAAAALLDAPRATLIEQPLARFILPEDQGNHSHGRRQLLATGERQTYDLRLRRADGAPRWVHLQINLGPEATSDHRPWRAILSDITARKRDEQALLENQARLRLITHLADLTFWEWDPKTQAVFFPPEWRQQTGYVLDELPRRLDAWAALLHPDDRTRILDHLTGFVDAPGESGEIQYRLRCQDGDERWFVARLEALLDPHGAVMHVLLVQQDVTRRKAAEDQAILLAQHDPLTGLPTRALLDQLAQHMLASTRRAGDRLAVLLFDLDHFKAVNDVYGHLVGDQLLQAVARRLRDSVRAADLVARLGGDEFVAVLASLHDADDAARAARTVLAALTPPYPLGGLMLHCVPSLGISLFPQDGDSLEALLQGADHALYHAKQRSPGGYQFVTEALNRQAHTTRTLEHRLREALSRQAFRLAYQPLLDPRTSRISGVEALLRWPQTDASQIAPLVFLPVAESSGLIHALGHWVLQESCRQHRAWCQCGLPPIPITVNVSARQFHHQRFHDQLVATLQATAMDPAELTLTLSEAALMQDLQASRQRLDALKALGVRLALDDFGLGCSSLNELERLPLDRLEINRALVQRLSLAERLPLILDTLIGLARALQLDVTAVGIETEADLDFFRQRACDQVQGFYLGVPMSGEQFADWYRQRSMDAR